MLELSERIYLVKKVDCHALSDKRIEALPEFFRLYPRAIMDLKEISDLVYLQESTLQKIIDSL
jgi:hypothetical protein